jgi:hypothetical protein
MITLCVRDGDPLPEALEPNPDPRGPADSYQGTQGAPFASVYLKRVGVIEYEGTFPLEEVTDLTEERIDLLAAWNAEHSE